MIAYTEVRGNTVEEYSVNLLAYAGERIDKVTKTFGEGTPQVKAALERWSEIFRHQVKMWPDDQNLTGLDYVPHSH